MKLNWQMRLDVRVWVLVEGILILFNSNLNIFLCITNAKLDSVIEEDKILSKKSQRGDREKNA